MNQDLPQYPADLTPLERRSLRLTREFFDTPPTMAALYRKNARRYVALLVVTGLVVLGSALLQEWEWAVFMAGVVAGVFFRDLGAFRLTVRLWRVSAAVIDRDRLDALLAEPTSTDSDMRHTGA